MTAPTNEQLARALREVEEISEEAFMQALEAYSDAVSEQKGHGTAMRAALRAAGTSPACDCLRECGAFLASISDMMKEIERLRDLRK